jgi:hypothetical protein
MCPRYGARPNTRKYIDDASEDGDANEIAVATMKYVKHPVQHGQNLLTSNGSRPPEPKNTQTQERRECQEKECELK